MHALRVQKAHILRQVRDRRALFRRQRIVERHVHAAVAILNIKDNRVAALSAPATNNFQTTLAARHRPGHVDGANFVIRRHADGFLHDGLRLKPRDRHLLAGFQINRFSQVIGFA